jgi:hypothetical protein
MIQKFKNWLFTRFLPMWAKESVFADYKKLQAENERLLVQLAEKEAYIEGLHAGMRHQRRIVINTGEVKK